MKWTALWPVVHIVIQNSYSGFLKFIIRSVKLSHEIHIDAKTWRNRFCVRNSFLAKDFCIRGGMSSSLFEVASLIVAYRAWQREFLLTLRVWTNLSNFVGTSRFCISRNCIHASWTEVFIDTLWDCSSFVPIPLSEVKSGRRKDENIFLQFS